MTDRPMIFSAPMVRALLEGRKTQTRRALRPQPSPHVQIYRVGSVWDWRDGTRGGSVRVPCANGGRIWVKESWAGYTEKVKGTRDGCRWFYYRATDEDDFVRGMKWRSPIHMPRWASRLTLIVTDVRVHRLQEISEGDARAEGVSPLPSGRYHCGFDEEGEITCKSPVTAYGWLWNSLNAKRGYPWESNPWCAALTFRVIQQNIDALPTSAAGM